MFKQSRNGKDMVYSPSGKGVVLRKIVFRSGNRHGER